MARPSKNAEGPSATDRMEHAFWECMKSMPYSEITVRDIVDRANVNRNSYYYHYESMWDLAKDSVQHSKLADLARALMDESTENVQHTEIGMEISATSAEQISDAYDQLRTLASENGNQKLLDDAKKIISDAWLAMYKLDAGSISSDIIHAINFTFGGITALLAGDQFASLADFKKTIQESDVLLDTFDVLRGELDPSIDRKNRWLHRSSLKKSDGRIVVEQAISEDVVSDSIVDKIMADVKSAPVREVLAPQPEPEQQKTEQKVEIEVEIKEEIVEITESEEIIVEEVEIQQEQDKTFEPEEAPTDEEPSEIVDEEIVEESDAAEIEAVEEESEEAESEQSQQPETQQATEEDYEENIEQEPVATTSTGDEFEAFEPIGVVSALESLQEIDEDDDDEQEPVRKYDASSPTRRFINKDKASTSSDLGKPKENATSSLTNSSATYADKTEEELDSGVDLDMVLDSDSLHDDEDDQLTMDFLF